MIGQVQGLLQLKDWVLDMSMSMISSAVVAALSSNQLRISGLATRRRDCFFCQYFFLWVNYIDICAQTLFFQCFYVIHTYVFRHWVFPSLEQCSCIYHHYNSGQFSIPHPSPRPQRTPCRSGRSTRYDWTVTRWSVLCLDMGSTTCALVRRTI